MIIIFLILLSSFIAYLTWFLRGNADITINYVDQLNKKIKPADVDENLNAASLYHKACEPHKKIPKTESFFDFFNDFFISKKYLDTTAEEKQMIEKMITDDEEKLELVKIGSGKPYYWEQYQGEDMLGAKLKMDALDTYYIAHALRWRAWLNADKGQYQKAFDDLKTCYRFGQHFSSSGNSIIYHLYGVVAEKRSVNGIRDILNSYQIDSKILAKLQKDMGQLITGQNFTTDFYTEKLMIYDEIQRSFTGKNYLNSGHVIPKRVIALALGVCEIRAISLFLHPDRDETQKVADNFFTFIDSVAGKTPAQMRAEGIDIKKECEKIFKKNRFLEVIFPAFGRIIETGYQVKAESYATIAVIALVRYKEDKGSYPEDLQELVTSGYLKELPMDPFSDGPLVYKKTDGDFLLYSVGLNFTDDGGEMGKDRSGKPIMWSGNGDAVFWPVNN